MIMWQRRLSAPRFHWSISRGGGGGATARALGGTRRSTFSPVLSSAPFDTRASSPLFPISFPFLNTGQQQQTLFSLSTARCGHTCASTVHVSSSKKRRGWTSGGGGPSRTLAVHPLLSWRICRSCRASKAPRSWAGTAAAPLTVFVTRVMPREGERRAARQPGPLLLLLLTPPGPCGRPSYATHASPERGDLLWV